MLEETGVPGESHWQSLSHNVVSNTPCHEQGLNSQLWYEEETVVKSGTDDLTPVTTSYQFTLLFSSDFKNQNQSDFKIKQ